MPPLPLPLEALSPSLAAPVLLAPVALLLLAVPTVAVPALAATFCLLLDKPVQAILAPLPLAAALPLAVRVVMFLLVQVLAILVLAVSPQWLVVVAQQPQAALSLLLQVPVLLPAAVL